MSMGAKDELRRIQVVVSEEEEEGGLVDGKVRWNGGWVIVVL